MAQQAAEIKSSDLESIAGKYLTFNLADEEYGLEILRVKEIIGMMEITTVPKTPAYVLGVINLRGKVIPIIDLRLKFGLDFKQPDDRTCIIVVEIMDQKHQIQMGIVVDRVNEVSDVGAQDVELSPSFGRSTDTSFILGMAKVGKRVKILLDSDKVLSSGELQSLSNI